MSNLINEELVKLKSSKTVEKETEDTRTVRYKKSEVCRPDYIDT